MSLLENGATYAEPHHTVVLWCTTGGLAEPEGRRDMPLIISDQSLVVNISSRKDSKSKSFMHKRSKCCPCTTTGNTKQNVNLSQHTLKKKASKQEGGYNLNILIRV